MKGILIGYEPVDYVSKKTGKPVKGCTIYFNCKTKDAFGYVGKSEYIDEASPIYKRSIYPVLEQLVDESSDIYGGTISIDYTVTRRGSATFTDVTDITITPKPVEGKKVG